MSQSSSTIHVEDSPREFVQSLPLALRRESIHRPLGIFNPTRASFSVSIGDDANEKGAEQWKEEAVWDSRSERKGRNSFKLITLETPSRWSSHDSSSWTPTNKYPQDPEKGGYPLAPQPSIVRVKHQHHHVKIKPHFIMDVSFWVAFVFTFGSMIWVVNGFLVFLPLLSPWRNLSPGILAAWERTASALGFVGGTLFEIGSYLMVVEAVNRGGGGISFGEELGRVIRGVTHRGKGQEKTGNVTLDLREQVRRSRKFLWWGKPQWRDLGYLAAAVQLAAASTFWVATLTGLPGVISNIFTTSEDVAVVDVLFWIPQVIGGIGFVISSSFLMLEAQTAWYVPNPTALGWHVGFWNAVGGAGFMLCGILGMPALHSTKANYQSALSTFWGSWSFLIGSAVQVVETILREEGDNTSLKGREVEEFERHWHITHTQARVQEVREGEEEV